MSKENNELDYLLKTLDNFTQELKNFEIFFKNREIKVKNELSEYKQEIENRNHELDNFKEILDKTKEYLLLELESNLDKQKQIQIKNEEKYNELIIYLKNENDNEIILLSEEVGRLKQLLTEKNEINKNLKQNEEHFKNKIQTLNNKIVELNDLREAEVKKTVEEKDMEIFDLTNSNNVK